MRIRRYNKENKPEKIGIYLPAEQKKWLREKANEEGISVSELLETFLKEKIKKEKTKAKESIRKTVQSFSNTRKKDNE